MNRDHRIYRRSTLLQQNDSPDWEETVDSLEVIEPVGPPDARFQLITTGLQLPACSFVSRTNDDVWYIDTGVEFDGGRMYVGERDFSGMASVAGYVSKASVSRVHEENERLEAELDLARALVIDLRAAVAGLVGATTVERSPAPRVAEPANTDEPVSLGDETDLRIWTLMLSSPAGVTLTSDEVSAPPDVFVVPDEFDDEPVVLMDDDDDDARFLMGILNIDGVAET